jgi:hypothetical protein
MHNFLPQYIIPNSNRTTRVKKDNYTREYSFYHLTFKSLLVIIGPNKACDLYEFWGCFCSKTCNYLQKI